MINVDTSLVGKISQVKIKNLWFKPYSHEVGEH